MMKFKYSYARIIIILFLCLQGVLNQQCVVSGYERCLCNAKVPNCACNAMTSTNSLNYNASYVSHLVFVEGQGCLTCPPSCIKCLTTTNCSSCFSSFQLTNSQCLPCPLNCQTCQNGICTICINGFYLDYQTSCQSCPIIGTLVCTINSLISCKPNYWLDNNAANCILCDAYCQQCSSISKCRTCVTGYYLLSNFTCKVCSSQCFSCNTGLSCIFCSNSSLYFENSMGKCSNNGVQNCLIPLNSKECLQCKNNFYLNSSICYAITKEINLCQNYIFYNKSISCRNCSAGYFNSTSGCHYGCSNLCTSCYGPHYGLCFGCISSAYLLNMHCIPIYNLNAGSSYQLLYTAPNHPSFFTGNLMRPTACILQAISYGPSVTFHLNHLQSYQISLWWKVYLFNSHPNNNTSLTSYSLRFNNSAAMLTYNFTCSSFVANCSETQQTCVHKGNSSLFGILRDSNVVSLDIGEGNSIGISELLIVAYRCGGINGQECLQCSSINYCTKCKNPSYFILDATCVSSCPDNYFLRTINNSCLIICPPQTYTILSNQSCLECNYPCLTCTSYIQCISCVSNMFLFQEKCLLNCPEYYYGNSIKKTCEKCIRPCLTCSSNLNCLSCLYGFYQNQTSKCVLKCKDGYYGQLSSLICKECAFPCSSCRSYEASKCQTCVQGHLLFNHQCLIECPKGYFQSHLKCQICEISCKNCESLASRCTSCHLGTFLYNFTCISNCAQRFYQDQLNNVCQLCPAECKTCINHLYCQECLASYYYLSSNYSCLNSCPDQYYSQNYLCYRCQIPCKSCTSANQCLSCKSLFLHNNSCLSQCPVGTFGSSMEMRCISCNSSQCLQCSEDINACTKCSHPKILFKKRCLNECPSGYYLSEFMSTCVRCQQNCKRCLNYQVCLQCVDQYAFLEGNCLKECISNYYLDQENQSLFCSVCPLSCSNCLKVKDQLLCTSCRTEFHFHQHACLPNCPTTYFSNHFICYKCIAPCLTCTSQSICQSCLPNLAFLLNSTCLSQCPHQYFQNFTAYQCQKCSQQCLKCRHSAQNCQGCPKDLVLQNNTCLTNCSSGYYSALNSNICYKCSEVCTLCANSPTFCLECSNITMALINGKCLSQCHIGYYKHNSKCLACSQYCSSCTDSLTCDRCTQKYYLTPNNSCEQVCPQLFFAANRICKKCQYPCKACDGYEQCLSCLHGYLYERRCLQSCNSPTFLNISTLTCNQCPINCSQCKDYSNCQACTFGVLMNGSCSQKCALGFYQYYSVCAPCIYGCLNCKNSTYCMSCFIGYLYNGICIEFCPLGYVPISINSSLFCQRCIQNCVKCSLKANQCTVCSNGYFLYIFSCVLDCPLGSYKDYQRSVCLSCKSPCQTCENGYSCVTCIYGYILYAQKSGNQCIQGPYCPNSYFLDTINNTCVYQCPLETFLQPINSICQNPCKKNFVLLQVNKTCLHECPPNMWIDNNLKCQYLPSPFPLPLFHCKNLIIRNLLLIECSFNLDIQNIQDLTKDSFYFQEQNFQIHQLYIINKRNVKLLINAQVGVYRQFSLTLHLKQRYLLYTNIAPSLLSSNHSRTLLSSHYQVPVQNIKNSFLIEEFFGYQSEQRLTGMYLKQIAQSISIGAFLFWFFSLLKNLKSTSLSFILLLQWIYSLSLLDINFPPNFAQFIEGFKITNLFFNSETDINPSIWIIESQYRQKLWGIINLFSFKIALLPPLILMLVFIMIYAFTKAMWFIFDKKQEVSTSQSKDKVVGLQQKVLQNVSKKSQESIFTDKIYSKGDEDIENNSKQSQKISGQVKKEQEQLKESQDRFDWKAFRVKFGHKCKLINDRFYYNYTLQVILLTLSPITIAICCQIINSNPLSLTFSIIFTLVYLTLIIIFINQSKKQQKLFISTKFWLIIFLQTILNNIFAILSTAELYIGIMILIFIINIFIWNKYFSSLRSNDVKYYYQVNEVLKIVLLVQIIIAYTNKSKWDHQTYYNYSWIFIGSLLVMIIFVAIQATKQFFNLEEGKKHDKIKEVEAEGKHEYDSQSEYSMTKKGKTKRNASIIDNMQIQEDEMGNQDDFFSNHGDDPLDEESESDIIDFDNRYEEGNKAPQKLIKYIKPNIN